MVLNKAQRDDLFEIVTATMDLIYKDDIELIQVGGTERSLAFRFGLYFYEKKKQKPWLSHLELDLEYNKNGLHPKRTPRRPKGVQPDFIMHKRNEHENNSLVIEFKGWWNNDREADIMKLEDFTSQEGEYKYGLGILIELNKDVPVYSFFCDYDIPKNYIS